MSFKSIELQVAIPRSQDAGKMQEQMMKQGQQFQETLKEKQLQEEIIKRQQVHESEDVEKGEIHDEDQASEQEKERQKDQDAKQKNESIDHPYLGRKIDFSG